MAHHHGDLRISIEGPEELPALPTAVEVAVDRIALEAMNNVVHRVEASSCMIRLVVDEAVGALRLEIEDDSRGTGENHRAGVGLIFMRQRTEELGGSCSIESVPSGGTCVRAFLPYVCEDVIKSEADKPLPLAVRGFSDYRRPTPGVAARTYSPVDSSRATSSRSTAVIAERIEALALFESRVLLPADC